jgi:hypothetical protein
VAAQARQRPLLAVVFSVPLFVEALLAACDGIADVQALRADDAGLEGLLLALRPDAAIVEAAMRPAYTLRGPLVHVELEEQRVSVLTAAGWAEADIDLSGEAIRNLALGAVFAGAVN